MFTFTLWFLLFVFLGRFQEMFPFLTPLQLGKVSVAFGLCAVLSRNTQDIGILMRDSPIKTYLIIMMVLAILGVPFSVYRSSALTDCMDFLRLLLTASVIVALGKERMYSMLLAITSVLLFISAQMLLNKATGRIAVSSTYDPNDIALLCLTFLPLAIMLVSHKNFIVKILALATSGGAVASIALSGSRGGFLSMVAVTAYAIILLKKKRMLLITLATIGGFIFVAMAGDALWERLQQVQDGTDYNFEAGAGRMVIWEKGLEVVLRRPIFGVGIGQFMTGIGTLTDGPWKAPHNTFLEITVDLGVGGFYAFCGILLFIYRLSVRGSKAEYLPQLERNLFLSLRLCLLGYCMAASLLSQAYSTITYSLFTLSIVMFFYLEKKEQEATQFAFEEQKDVSVSNEALQHTLTTPQHQKIKALQGTRFSSTRIAQLKRAASQRAKKKACLDAGDMLRKKKHLENIK